MALYLIRHGQTDYNLQRRWQGRVDVPLNSTGRSQSVRIRDFLINEKIRLNKIFVSPLSRAVETAQIIADHDSAIVIDKRLIEIDLGRYDGRHEEGIAKEIGEEKYNTWRDQNFLLPAPGGESFIQLMARVDEFLAENTTSMVAGQFGIVAHQGVLMALKSVISGDSSQGVLNDFKQKNSEIEVWDIAVNCLVRKCEII